MQQESMPQQAVELPFLPKDRIQITMMDSGEEFATPYECRVTKVSGTEIVIRWPVDHGLRATICQNNLFCIFHSTGFEAYTIDARVVKLILYPESLVVLRCEGPLRKTQRRDHVRVPAMIDVRLTPRLVVATSQGDERPETVIMARTVDISGGGFNIHHDAPLQMGSTYDVKMKLPGLGQLLSLTARIVRMRAAVNRLNKTYYDIGFLFVTVDETVRRQIVKYVFRFQQTSLVKNT